MPGANKTQMQLEEIRMLIPGNWLIPGLTLTKIQFKAKQWVLFL